MSLIAELKRRNVFRVGVAYAIVGWLLVEVASVVMPTFKAPEWVMQVFTFLVILGFPLAKGSNGHRMSIPLSPFAIWPVASSISRSSGCW
jgi:hypothetical protein